jgi:hypothetical protein
MYVYLCMGMQVCIQVHVYVLSSAHLCVHVCKN